MRKPVLAAALSALLSACASTTPPPAAPSGPAAGDPYLWLEEIDSPRALEWVAAQNERTRRELASSPEFSEMQRDALAVLDSGTRVPSLAWHGGFLYNLWKDESHQRGLYRRTSPEELRGGSPRWTTVLDVDDLSRREGKRWVFKGMTCLPPQERRCLVSLSPGGGDAVEIREFDAAALRFVEGGFFLPLAKSGASWVDEDSLLVETDFGPGTLTESGYPRIVKLWKRGTPLADAPAVHEVPAQSVRVAAFRLRTDGAPIDLVIDRKTTWSGSVSQRIDGTLHPLALPETANVVDAFEGRLVIRLQDDWKRDGAVIPAGSVILADPAARRGPGGPVEILVEPASGEVVDDVEVTDKAILVTTLENVRARLYRYTRTAAGWNRDRVAFPDNGALSVMTTESRSGDALVEFESFLDPPALYHLPFGGGAATVVAAQQPTFDGSRFEVTQQWAVSADGTRVPYFVVGPKGMKRDGTHPVHIFSYGGFRSALTPSYSGSYEPHYGLYGKLWLEKGGVFVLANIRGGGEFGPAWHSSVLKQNRRKVFEDFEAVAAHLVSSGVTRPEKIGIEGRSNGGLLTLGTMTRRPELYGAVISGAPLSDMLRYHELLAGASWMAEYGDPRIAAEREWIAEWSPYQRFRAGVAYPPLFVYASTRYDRVHPGHARKTVARLLEQGHDVWYFENTEGGHGGSSTNEQLATRIALSYAHLWRSLGGRQ